MSTRIPAMFEIRMPATLQPFRRARPGRQAAVVSAAGVPLAPHAPDGRCHTFRSPPGFRSATRCFRCFHSSLTLDGPHDTRARHAPEIEPANTASGPGLSMGAHVRWVCRTMGRESQTYSFHGVGALHGVLGCMGSASHGYARNASVLRENAPSPR